MRNQPSHLRCSVLNVTGLLRGFYGLMGSGGEMLEAGRDGLRGDQVESAQMRNGPVRNGPMRNGPMKNAPIERWSVSLASVPAVEAGDPRTSNEQLLVFTLGLSPKFGEEIRLAFHAEIRPFGWTLILEATLSSKSEIYSRNLTLRLHEGEVPFEHRGYEALLKESARDELRPQPGIGRLHPRYPRYGAFEAELFELLGDCGLFEARDERGRTLDEALGAARAWIASLMLAKAFGHEELSVIPPKLHEALLGAIAVDRSGRILEKLCLKPDFIVGLGFFLGFSPHDWVEAGELKAPLQAIARSEREREIIELAADAYLKRRGEEAFVSEAHLKGVSSAFAYAKLLRSRPISLQLAIKLWEIQIDPTSIPEDEELRESWVSFALSVLNHKYSDRIKRYLIHHARTLSRESYPAREKHIDVLLEELLSDDLPANFERIPPKALLSKNRRRPLPEFSWLPDEINENGFNIRIIRTIAEVRRLGLKYRNCLSRYETTDVGLNGANGVFFEADVHGCSFIVECFVLDVFPLSRSDELKDLIGLDGESISAQSEKEIFISEIRTFDNAPVPDEISDAFAEALKTIAREYREDIPVQGMPER